MNVLIVDDEMLARARIAKYLKVHRPDWFIREAVDGPDALEKVHEARPDLILLDIEMPEMNGFSVLQNLGDNPPKVIFQTAYDQYAIKAFDANACDYLLKPFTDERLESALRKVVANVENNAKRLSDVLVADQRFMTAFMVSVGPRLKVIDEADIIYFLSSEHTTRIFLKSGIDYAYQYSLSYLESRIDPQKFLRVHRNAIVRLTEIAAIDKGSNMQVTLKNGATLPVSRERRKDVLAAFENE